MSSNSDLIDFKQTQQKIPQATNVNTSDYKSRFKPITFENTINNKSANPGERTTAALKTTNMIKTTLPIPTSPLQSIDTTNTTSTSTATSLQNHIMTETQTDEKTATLNNGTGIKDTLMFNSFFPLNMNDSIKEEANDTLTRDEELDITQDSNTDTRRRHVNGNGDKDLEEGEIVENDDESDEDDVEDENEEEESSEQDDDHDAEDASSSGEDMPERKQRANGFPKRDQQSDNSDDDYIEESDYQSQSPTCQDRSNISSDQSETHESP